jgi:hypothetical protein
VEAGQTQTNFHIVALWSCERRFSAVEGFRTQVLRPTEPGRPSAIATALWSSWLSANFIVNDTGEPDVIAIESQQHAARDLRDEALVSLLAYLPKNSYSARSGIPCCYQCIHFVVLTDPQHNPDDPRQLAGQRATTAAFLCTGARRLRNQAPNGAALLAKADQREALSISASGEGKMA